MFDRHVRGVFSALYFYLRAFAEWMFFRGGTKSWQEKVMCYLFVCSSIAVTSGGASAGEREFGMDGGRTEEQLFEPRLWLSGHLQKALLRIRMREALQAQEWQIWTLHLRLERRSGLRTRVEWRRLLHQPWVLLHLVRYRIRRFWWSDNVMGPHIWHQTGTRVLRMGILGAETFSSRHAWDGLIHDPAAIISPRLSEPVAVHGAGRVGFTLAFTISPRGEV